MMMLKQILLSVVVCTICVFSAQSQSLGEIDIEKRVSGLGVPWGMTFIDEEKILVSEKSGSLKIIDFSTSPASINDIQGLPSVMEVGQGGMLDIKIAPNIQKEIKHPMLYFTFVAASTLPTKTNLPTLKLARASLQNNSLVDLEILFEANHPQKGGRHFGSRIAFDNAGHVFISMGDRGQRENSQDLSKHSGSILRLNLDGSIPEDNPFVGQTDAMPEIWSYGHRNPQGLAFDSAQQRLWSNEHGPRGGDEINIISKGKNYGWPIISYGREYISNRKVGESTEKPGMEQPIYYFSPSIAPGSLMVYSGLKKTDWQGVVFSGALKLRHLNLVFIDQDYQFVKELRLFEEQSQRIRNVIESPLGDIFISTDNGDIFQLRL